MLFQNGTNWTDKYVNLINSSLSLKNVILKLGWLVPNSYFKIHKPVELKLLLLRVELSHLNEHIFEHNFSNCINPLCSSKLQVELTTYFF